MTTWTNPTQHEQRVALDREYVIAPGASVEIHPRFDSAIQCVHGCGHKTGHCGTTGRCHDLAHAPRTAVIVGGLAPGLVHANQAYRPWKPSLPRVVRD